MTNGWFVRMVKGNETKLYWVFPDGAARESTGAVVEDFSALFNSLRREGYREEI